MLSSSAPVFFRGSCTILGVIPVPYGLAVTPIVLSGRSISCASHGGRFEILDEYEGRRFRRKQVTILQEEGKSITCWIYLYARSITHRSLIRSGDYVQYRKSF